MAEHEGWYLKANVDISGLLQANKQANSLLATLKKVDAGVGTVHGNDALSRQIKSADIATASYIERLKSAGKTYEADQEKARMYSDQVQRLTSRQKGLVTELDRIAEKSGRTSDAYNIQKARINQTATAINNFKKDLHETQSEMDRLHPTGFNKWVAGAKQVNHANDTIKEKVHGAWESIKGGSVVAAGAIGAVGAAAISGAKKASSLQQTYKEINNLAVLGGEKQKEVTSSLAKMQSEARDISLRYGKSQQSLAEGYEDLVKRGYTTKQAVGALTAEVQASVASGDKFSDVTSVSSQAIEAFGLKANSTAGMIRNTQKAVNMLAYSADATSTGFHSLGDSVSYFGAAAKAQHISLAESASAVGVLSNNGIEGSMGGTAMRDIINRIGNGVNSIGKKNSTFTALGISKNELLDSQGHLKSLADSMDVIWKHIQEHSKNSVQEQGFMKSVFGTTAQNAATILAQNTHELRDLTARTQKAGEQGSYVAKMAQKNMATAQGSMARAKQAVTNFSIILGAKMLPVVAQATDKLSKFLTTKEGKQFEKDVAGAVSRVTNALVGLLNWATTHKTAMKLIGGSIIAGYSVAKGAEFISFLGETKKNIRELKGSAGIINSLATSISNLNNAENGGGSFDLSKLLKGKTSEATKLTSIGLPKGTGKVLTTKTAEEAAADSRKVVGLKTGATQLAVNKAGSLLRTGTSKMFGGKLLSKGATKLGTKLGGSAGTGMTAMAGAGIALTSGVDIYKAVTTKNPKSKFRNYGKAIGSAIGGGIGLYLGGPAGAAIGTMLGQVAGKWAGNMAHRFSKSKFGKAVGRTFKQASWEIKQDLRPMSREVNGTVRSVKRSFSGMSRDISKDWRDLNRNKDFRAFKNFLKSGLTATLRFAIKQGSAIIKTGIGIATGVIHAFLGTIKGITGVVRGVVKVASDIFHGNWSKAWKDAKGIVDSAVGAIKSVVEGLKKVVDSVFGGILSTAKNVWDFISGKDWNVADKKENSTSVSSANASVARMKNGSAKTYHAPKSKANDIAAINRSTHLKAHASGTRSFTAHGALVGEAGPELAYKPYGSARLLGARGPQFAKVRSGERILNARDTAKVMSGGLGTGLVLKGYATGNTKLAKTTRTVSSDYKKINANATKSLNALNKHSRSTWSKITTQTGKQTDKTRKSTVSDYSTMRVKVDKQMDKMHDGVITSAESTSKGFGKAMDKMNGYAKNAMSDTIGQLNKGITSIDHVLSQFGGNGQVIKPVRFATGTGALPHDTLAMVNDAPTGPRQEAIVKANGDVHIPRGHNRVLPLQKGDSVLNGYQTKQLADAWGLKHFAKGSGVSTSRLQKIASQGLANPSKSFADSFTSSIKSSAPQIQRGTTDLAKNSSTHYGNPWMGAMWQVINDAIGGANGKGGTREAFLKYAESTFSGVPYVMGAMSKAASDCSGMVAQALRHFGINIGRTTVAMQESSGVQYLGKSLSRTLPGDLVIFGHGTGAAGHVGIIKNPKTGSMFNETPPHARVTDIASDKSMGYGYYRVKGLHNEKPKTASAKPDKSLMSLAKRELGAKALGWIKSNLAEDDDLGGMTLGKATGDHNHWLKQAKIPEKYWTAMDYIFSHEAGWNPHARNPSSGTYGLAQMQGYNLHYYRKYGSINNPLAQIRGGYDYMNQRYGSPNGALRFWQSHHWYAKGGTHRTQTPFIAGENGPELITASNPVHIDSHETTKRKFRGLADVINGIGKNGNSAPQVRRRGNGQPVTFNININGPISNRRDAIELSNLIKAKVAEIIYNLFGDEEGGDPSIY